MERREDHDAPGGWLPSAAELRLLTRWTRRYAVLPRLEEAARDATEEEWCAVHLDWQFLAAIVQSVGIYAEDDAPEEFAWMWRRVVIAAGPWLTLVDLSMRRQGQGKTWDDIRGGISEFTEQLEVDPDMQRQVRVNWLSDGQRSAV